MWGGCGGLVPFVSLEDCESSCNESVQVSSNQTLDYPVIFKLNNCYPNPFNPVTTLRYDLPEDALVNIIIYDMMGRVVKTLINDQQTAGYKSLQWNATNDADSPVSAGIYLYTIQAGEFRQTKKMVLLK
ncbi:MAG TPA: T9SS type A sorting domain-containing protein [Candidatus Marinimicrobia bacterium]|nr:T9SS type A sorting domain-containing protein [Candidatus Neomarinimicrobiota bacterium]